jgi:hypothetical protein
MNGEMKNAYKVVISQNGKYSLGDANIDARIILKYNHKPGWGPRESFDGLRTPKRMKLADFCIEQFNCLLLKKARLDVAGILCLNINVTLFQQVCGDLRTAE